MIKRCFVFTALCLILAGAAPAQQTWSGPKLRADVPFDFVVSGTTLPAGTYEVSTSSTGRMLMIRNQDHGQYSAMVTNIDLSLSAPNINQETKLVFLLDNGHHMLHQVKLQGDAHFHDICHGNDVPELVAER